MKRVYYWHSAEYLKSKKRDYVIKTIEDYNDLAHRIEKDTDWYEEFMILVNHYLQQEIVGGCLHLVLEDGNLDDNNLSWCGGLAYGMQDHEAGDLVGLMQFMTMEQRRRVYEGE